MYGSVSMNLSVPGNRNCLGTCPVISILYTVLLSGITFVTVMLLYMFSWWYLLGSPLMMKAFSRLVFSLTLRVTSLPLILRLESDRNWLAVMVLGLINMLNPPAALPWTNSI